jgi:hypothetical protein
MFLAFVRENRLFHKNQIRETFFGGFLKKRETTGQSTRWRWLGYPPASFELSAKEVG